MATQRSAVSPCTSTTGRDNSAFGSGALGTNWTGSYNSAFGREALGLAMGQYNVALGYQAGFNQTSGNNNIYIDNAGVAAESSTIHIGRVGTHTATYVAGISGTAVDSGTATSVLVDASGKLGTLSSSARFKEGIESMGEESTVLMSLRPVAFYYKHEYDKSHSRQYGLVAEEVAKVAPQLVVYDDDNQPQTVRYHLVNAMLLNEVQKQRATIERQSAEIQALEERLEKLEAARQP